MVNEYLRRLQVRGLTERRGGPLTRLGSLTLWWYQTGGIRDFNVANLLAIAWTAQGDRASALVQVAAVLYHPDPSLSPPITSLLEFKAQAGKPADIQGLLREEVDGLREEMDMDVSSFALDYVSRGPVWAAVAVWMSRRAAMRQVNTSDAESLSLCDGTLLVSQQALYKIQHNWTTMSHRWTTGLGGARLSLAPSIDGQDFLFLEESLVRVWMHNLVLVGMADSGMGAFARDLASGTPITRLAGDPVDWVRLTEQEDSEPAEGEQFTGVFAFYTALDSRTAPDGSVGYVPAANPTFISTRAIRHVLRGVANSNTQDGLSPPRWQDLLCPRYQTHC